MAETEIFDDYTYVLVKIAHAKATLLPRQRLVELIDSRNLEEFKSKFASMQKDISSDVIYNSKDLEISCRNVFFTYIKRIIYTSPRGCHAFIATFLQKYQIENIKTVLAAKIAKIDEMILRDRINFQIESIFRTETVMREAIHANTFEDVIFVYSHSPYREILREIQKRFESTKEIFFIYTLLDRFYIRNLYKSIKSDLWTEQELDIFKFYAGTLADFYNLIMIIHGINNNFEWNEVEVLLTTPRETFKIKHDDLKALHRIGNDTQKIAEWIKSLGKRYLGGSSFIYSIDPARVINSLKKFYYNIQLAYFRKRKLNDGYEFAEIISFMLQKEVEIDNIITILEGIKLESDKETLKDFLITVM